MRIAYLYVVILREVLLLDLPSILDSLFVKTTLLLIAVISLSRAYYNRFAYITPIERPRNNYRAFYRVIFAVYR